MSGADVNIAIRVLDGFDRDLPLPRMETGGAAGLDLRACLAPGDRERGVIIPPLGRHLVPTGLAMAIPEGWEGQVRPRSGLAIRHGITVLNAPGTIDSDYRGEVMVAIINLGQSNFTLEHGERVAQLVLARHGRAHIEVVTELDATDRAGGGFGSTGRG